METRTARVMHPRWLDWIDRRSPVRFTLLLYALRWVVLLPVMMLIQIVGPGASSEAMFEMLAGQDLLELFLGLIVEAPLSETLVECSLPYLALRFLLRERRMDSRRPWIFVATSALVMVCLHPIEWQTVVLTAITGTFLGYTYGHFAPHGHVRAFLVTAAFHAAINLVGFSMIAYSKWTGAQA
jgi:hypothetical protein